MTAEEDLGFILRSEYRKKVFLLIDGLIMPSQIQKSTDLRLTHITRELRFLKDRRLVECVNPKERVGRLYRLTDKGKKVKKKLVSEELI